MTKKKPILNLPRGFDLQKSYSLQAILDGRANKEQQVEGMKYLVEDLCGTYNDTFDPDSERLSNRLQGRRSVGLDIVQIAKLRLDKVKEILSDKKPDKENQ